MATVDKSFIHLPGFNTLTNALAIQNDGKAIIGGGFSAYNGATRQRIARLNVDGTLDISFDSSSGFSPGTVREIAIQKNGKIIAGGSILNSYDGNAIQNIVRINADGTFDGTFNSNPGIAGTVFAITIQPDGKILVGGEFNSYAGTAAERIVRLNTDGTIDNTFNSNPGFDAIVFSLNIQSDGRIIVGGSFESYGATAVKRIARLNPDGSIDNTFNSNPGFNNTVRAVKLRFDGKMFVGGNFTSYKGTTVEHIALLNANGNLDTTFVSDPGFNNNPEALHNQRDGKIIAAGDFTSYGGTAVGYLARLNIDGSLDTTFYSGPGFNDQIEDMEVRPNGKILVVGSIEEFNGIAVAIGVAQLYGSPLMPIRGESVRLAILSNSDDLSTSESFEIPIADTPAQTPGSISLASSAILVRKPDGTIGSINVT